MVLIYFRGVGGQGGGGARGGGQRGGRARGRGKDLGVDIQWNPSNAEYTKRHHKPVHVCTFK
jgi:hypothetical protein